MPIELAQDNRPTLRRWFALMDNGKLAYVGHFASFEDAILSEPKKTIWLFDEESAREWAQFLTEAVA